MPFLKSQYNIYTQCHSDRRHTKGVPEAEESISIVSSKANRKVELVY
jgi:hypothetical protein